MRLPLHLFTFMILTIWMMLASSAPTPSPGLTSLTNSDPENAQDFTTISTAPTATICFSPSSGNPAGRSLVSWYYHLPQVKKFAQDACAANGGGHLSVASFSKGGQSSSLTTTTTSSSTITKSANRKSGGPTAPKGRLIWYKPGQERRTCFQLSRDKRVEFKIKRLEPNKQVLGGGDGEKKNTEKSTETTKLMPLEEMECRYNLWKIVGGANKGGEIPCGGPGCQEYGGRRRDGGFEYTAVPNEGRCDEED